MHFKWCRVLPRDHFSRVSQVARKRCGAGKGAWSHTRVRVVDVSKEPGRLSNPARARGVGFLAKFSGADLGRAPWLQADGRDLVKDAAGGGLRFAEGLVSIG